MAFLTINSLDIAVKDETANKTIVEVGSGERSFGGKWRDFRRAIKREWEFETPFQNEDTSEFIEHWLLGRGWHWSFDTSLWSDNGVPPVTGYASALFGGTPKFGTVAGGQGSLQLNPAPAAQGGVDYTVPWATAYNNWSIMFYFWGTDAGFSGAWHHIFIQCDNGTVTTYKDGVSYSTGASTSGTSPLLTWTPTSLGFITITNNGTTLTVAIDGENLAGTQQASTWIDDLVIWPFVVPLSYAVTRYTDAGTTTAGTTNDKSFSALPRLKAYGEFLREPGPIDVRAVIKDIKYAQATESSTWKYLRSIKFSLMEV